MGMSEIQRKMRYMSMGAEQHESMRRREFRKEYISQYCKNMRLDQHVLKNSDPEYYEIIMNKAAEATDKMWEEEQKLIDKWEEQNRKIRESVTMA